MDVPELTDELVDRLESQSDEQSGAHSIRELERIRDRNLAGIMRALEENDWGAGNTLKTSANASTADQQHGLDVRLGGVLDRFDVAQPEAPTGMGHRGVAAVTEKALNTRRAVVEIAEWEIECAALLRVSQPATKLRCIALRQRSAVTFAPPPWKT